jgi:hypothetical protein
MCNSHKADRQEAVDPESQVTVPLFNPRAERWDEHFEWVEAGAGSSALNRGEAHL